MFCKKLKKENQELRKRNAELVGLVFAAITEKYGLLVKVEMLEFIVTQFAKYIVNQDKKGRKK